MKLCIFSGTFNPIHNAHLKIAEHVLINYGFDRILFIPAFKPPHKDFDEKMSNHRYKMVELAINYNNKFCISNIEYENDRLSYTYFTILELYKRYEIDGKINMIIGTDAFEKIETWYESDKLKDLVEFVVFLRKNEKVNFLHLQNKGYNFKLAGMDFLDISSTSIREKIRNIQDINGLIPNNVKEYIEKYGLYRNL